MGGVNPYIKPADYKLPSKPYTIKFIFEEDGTVTEVEVDPAKIPYDREGLPGSVLDIAEGSGLSIDHACGGVVACSTCHIIVNEGFNSCNEATEDEEDMLDLAPGVSPNSRLACQCVADGSKNITVTIPQVNRNYLKHEH